LFADDFQNYTLRGDFGVTQLNVPTPKNDDLQKRFLPLQWALESVSEKITKRTIKY